MTQDEPQEETPFLPWKDTKDYGAIFRRYRSTGDDGKEHYDGVDMERDSQRAVRRIQDDQGVVKQYPKVVRAYNKFMTDCFWMIEGLMQDNCRFGDMLKDEKRKVCSNINWEDLWVTMQYLAFGKIQFEQQRNQKARALEEP